MKNQKFPQIDSIEELAQFWDTHDLTDFEADLEEVTEAVFERKPDTMIPLHLHPQELAAIRRVAQAQGVEETALIREWVIEKLHGSV